MWRARIWTGLWAAIGYAQGAEPLFVAEGQGLYALRC